jgi:hypothetical protein
LVREEIRVVVLVSIVEPTARDRPVLAGALGVGVVCRGVVARGVVVAGGVVGRSFRSALESAGDICRSRLRLSAAA